MTKQFFGYPVTMSCWSPVRRSLGAVVVVAPIVLHSYALASAPDWRDVPGSTRFARAGASPVTLELHRENGFGCGGGGCSTVVTIRNVRGPLPAGRPDYYFPDRPDAVPGCLGPDYGALFDKWSEAEIVPVTRGWPHQPRCGIAILVGRKIQYWAILRVRTIGSNAPAASGGKP